MHDGQNFVQTEFLGTTHTQEVNELLGDAGDVFGYPMSAPITASEPIWDTPSLGVSMDVDYAEAAPAVFQYPTTPLHRTAGSISSGHRPSASFDWNSEVPLFEAPQARPPSSQKEKARPPARRQRALVPKPPASRQPNGNATGNSAAATPKHPMIDFSFPMPGALGGTDPGMMSNRPQTSATDASFNLNEMDPPFPLESVVAPPNGNLGRSTSVNSGKNGRSTSPPKQSLTRPGLARRLSGNKGRRGLAQAPALKQSALSRPTIQTNGDSSIESSRSMSQLSGRISPVKPHHSQQLLASIPEAGMRPVSRASVVFTIDNLGHARAEQCEPSDYRNLGRLTRSRSSRSVRSLSFPHDEAEDSDDEPIILPSRNGSFALPDPRKPIGSYLQFSRRSTSHDSAGSPVDDRISMVNGMESENETLMHEGIDQDGSAVSELLEIVKHRKKMAISRTQSGRSNGQRGLRASASLGNMAQRRNIRCVCPGNGADQKDGFMIQCQSCEMWLHGKCVNQTRRTKVLHYICVFCSKLNKGQGGQVRDSSAAGLDPTPPPSSHKPFRSWR